MTTHTPAPGELLATVDTKELHSIRWGIMRQLFPGFAAEIELGRYVRTLLTSGRCNALRIEPHRLPDGHLSSSIFDVFQVS